MSEKNETPATIEAKPIEIQISRNTLEIKKLLQSFEVNQLGKPIYITKEITEELDDEDDNLSTLKKLFNPNTKIKEELVAIALPLSNDEIPSWLIITTDGDIVRVDPPKDPNDANRFKNIFSNLISIKIKGNQGNQGNQRLDITNKYGPLMTYFFSCEIPYNTATDYISDEIKARIGEDIDKALEISAEIRKSRLKSKLDTQNMLLEKLGNFFNPSE